MKIHRDIKQGELEWNLLRCGKITASGMDALVTPMGKVKDGEAVKTYMLKLIAEQWQGGPLPAAQGSWDMDQGVLLEKYARPAFSLETGLDVEEVGCIVSDCGKYSCSPDGLVVGQEAGLEIKSPRLENHLRYLLDGGVPKEYVLQVQFSLWLTGWRKWYFCSFRRFYPPLIVLVEADEKVQKAIFESVTDFWKRFDASMAKLIAMNGGPPNPKYRGIIPFPKTATEMLDINV